MGVRFTKWCSELKRIEYGILGEDEAHKIFIENFFKNLKSKLLFELNHEFNSNIQIKKSIGSDILVKQIKSIEHWLWYIKVSSSNTNYAHQLESQDNKTAKITIYNNTKYYSGKHKQIIEDLTSSFQSIIFVILLKAFQNSIIQWKIFYLRTLTGNQWQLTHPQS